MYAKLSAKMYFRHGVSYVFVVSIFVGPGWFVRNGVPTLFLYVFARVFS